MVLIVTVPDSEIKNGYSSTKENALFNLHTVSQADAVKIGADSEVCLKSHYGTPVKVYFQHSGLVKVYPHDKTLKDHARTVGRDVMDLYRDSPNIFNVTNFFDYDFLIHKNQNNIVVNEAFLEVVHIKGESFSYVSIANACSTKSTMNYLHFKKMPNQSQQIEDHQSLQAKTLQQFKHD